MSPHIQKAPYPATRPPAAPVWTRDEAIRRLRQGLETMTDEEHSMCQVAAKKAVFCRGFRRWSDSEFHRKWKPAIGSSTFLTRAQMEEFANFWLLTEQARLGVGFACDAQALCRGACRGWNEFGNDQLERYCAEVLEVTVQVVESSERDAVFVPAPVDEADEVL